MWLKRLALILIGLLLLAGGIFFGSYVVDQEQPFFVRDVILKIVRRAPTITSVEPKEAAYGTKVTIRGTGFKKINDVAFRLNQSNQEIGCHWMAESSDGATIDFELSDTVGVCGPPEGVRILIGLQLQTGPTKIWVMNENGSSNKVSFTILPADNQDDIH